MIGLRIWVAISIVLGTSFALRGDLSLPRIEEEAPVSPDLSASWSTTAVGEALTRQACFERRWYGQEQVASVGRVEVALVEEEQGTRLIFQSNSQVYNEFLVTAFLARYDELPYIRSVRMYNPRSVSGFEPYEQLKTAARISDRRLNVELRLDCRLSMTDKEYSLREEMVSPLKRTVARQSSLISESGSRFRSSDISIADFNPSDPFVYALNEATMDVFVVSLRDADGRMRTPSASLDYFSKPVVGTERDRALAGIRLGFR